MSKKKTGRQVRSIDKAAKESRNWLSHKMVLMQKKKIAALRGFMLVAFMVGAVVMLVWSVNVNIETNSKASSALNQQTKENGNGKFVKGELLVRFRSEASKENQDKILGENGAKEKDEIAQIRVKRISVPEQVQDKVREALAKNPNVEFVENNSLAQAALTPNDTNYVSQWHLPNVSAPAGWDISTGSSGVPITICDSGIDLTHPDLAGKLLPGYNFYDNNNNVADVQGHGTAVAGSAAAISNNATGVASMAWANPIMPVRISDPSAWATYAAMAQCITYGVDHGSRVINISYGGTTASATLQSAAGYAWSKNALVFASAANNGVNTPMYPAATDHVVGVIATDSSNNKASFSNYGSWTDIAAPGVNIYTTSMGGGYGYHSGTSFASPLVAGLAALVISVNPNLSAQDVYDVLTKNTDDLGTPGFDDYFAWGRINMAKTLAAAKTYVSQNTTSITTTTTTTTTTPGKLNVKTKRK